MKAIEQIKSERAILEGLINHTGGMERAMVEAQIRVLTWASQPDPIQWKVTGGIDTPIMQMSTLLDLIDKTWHHWNETRYGHRKDNYYLHDSAMEMEQWLDGEWDSNDHEGSSSPGEEWEAYLNIEEEGR